MASRILLALALLVAGCSTFTESELAQIRQTGLRPELLYKMEHRRVLSPEDLIELKRAGVRDSQVVKQLNDAGVDYVASRPDVSKLRKAGVSAWVIDALLRASERFSVQQYGSPFDDYYYGYYGDPWWPGFYGGWGIDYQISGRGWHGGHGGHHRR